jgi:hypothetical protein
MRLAQTDADAAATRLDAGGPARWTANRRPGPGPVSAARPRSACTDAATQIPAGLAAAARPRPPAGWSDDTLAWGVRALRAPRMDRERWAVVLQSIDWMSAAELRRTRPGPTGRPGPRPGAPGRRRRPAPRQRLQAWPAATNFYAQLAAEDLGRAAGPAADAGPADRGRARRAGADHPACSAPCRWRTWACATKAGASGTSRCAAWATASCWPPPSWPARRPTGSCASTPASARAGGRRAPALPHALRRRDHRPPPANAGWTRPSCSA